MTDKEIALQIVLKLLDEDLAPHANPQLSESKDGAEWISPVKVGQFICTLCSELAKAKSD